ncbi:MFS transporter [Rhizobium binxianense]
MEYKKRWLVIIGLFIANTVNYVDRVGISVAIPEIARDFGLGPEATGFVLSCFFYSYLLLIVPMGLLTDRFGARFVMVSGMFIWVLGSGLTGASASLSMLIVARLILGVGESSSYPSSNRIIRDWAPRTERGVMVSIFSAGASAGPAVGILGISALLSHFDWRDTFYIIAALTLVLTIIWLIFYRSPEKAAWLSKEEHDYIIEQREPTSQGVVRPMSLASVLKQPVMWGLLITHGCQVYSIYLFLTWLPSYLRDVRHLDLASTGWLGMLPYLVSTIGVIALGAVSDRLIKGQDLSTGARRKFMIVLMVLAACVLFVPFANDLWIMEVLLIASVLFSQAANTLNYALAADLIYDRKSAGVVFGLLVLGGNGFGFVAPILTGYIIAQTHAYTLSFALAGLLLLIGVAVSWFCVRSPLQPDREPAFDKRSGLPMGTK